MKLVFFGTSNVALPVLEALHREEHVLAVVTAPDAKVGRKQVLSPSPVSILAEELGLPVLKPETVKNNPEFLQQLQGLGAEIFIVVSYGKILPEEVINLPPHKTVNIHFSRLPEYRGASPIQFALMNGDVTTATSIFVLEPGLDTGPIVAQQETKIDHDDTFLTLSQRMARQSAELLLSVLPDYISGKITPLPQDEGQVSLTRIITKQDGKIDWTKPAQEIYNQFRAFYPWPGLWTTWQGKVLKVLDCVPVEQRSDDPVGTVLNDGLVACSNNTTLKINSIQLEGKNPAKINEFLNGYKNFVGSKLE
jgi:methionyl-tRNA formyltransferase